MFKLTAKDKAMIGKFVTFTIVVLIMVVILYLIIYRNRDEDALSQDTNSAKNTEKNEQNAISSGQAVINPGIVDRQIVIFVDKNENGVKDDDELECGECVAKALVAGKIGDSGQLPPADELVTVTVGGGGIVETSTLADTNTVWGFFPDRDVFIEPFDISVDETTPDVVYVPMRRNSLAIKSINASVVDVDRDGLAPDQAVYVLNALIPSMKEAFDSEQELWVYYEPDTGNLDRSYLTSAMIEVDYTGQVTGRLNSYYVDVTIGTGTELPGMDDLERVTFVLL